jgi:putative transposase
MVADKKQNRLKKEKTVEDRLLDELVADYKSPEDMIGENGLLRRLTKKLLERALDTELTAHLGYEKHAAAGRGSGNSRNGVSPAKTLKGDFGELELKTPRDRNGTFEPKLVAKHQTRFTGFDDKIISMYARGMTTRDIMAHLQEVYGVDVSPALISQVTDAVMDEVQQWQMRPLEETYAILYLDALHVKIRNADSRQVENRAVNVAMGVTLAGSKEVLGLWIGTNEGAAHWLHVLTEIQSRGVKDVLIACVDGLKGFPEAIETVFPKAQVQLCIVHMVRASLNYVPWKDRKTVAADLRGIYQSATQDEGELRLSQVADKWEAKYPMAVQVWRRNWERITPFFAYPGEIRRVIYTTNAIESLNMTLRKIIKTRGGFPTEEAALKLLYLGLRNAAKKWTMPVRDWKQAMNRFHILWPDRVKVS